MRTTSYVPHHDCDCWGDRVTRARAVHDLWREIASAMALKCATLWAPKYIAKRWQNDAAREERP